MDKGILQGDRSAKSFVLDLLFPNRCPFCGGFIKYDVLCCDECFPEILWSDEYICRICGKPKDPQCGCEEVRTYDMCITAAYYEGIVTEGIYSLKFRNNLNSAAIFGRALRDTLRESGLLDKADLAVPVPMSPREQRVRGYNQAEELCRFITEGTDIPVRMDILFRRYSRKAQHTLEASQRREGAERTYYVKSSDLILSGKTVLLADDVLTTGSTLNACAALLKELGAKAVICAAAATA